MKIILFFIQFLFFLSANAQHYYMVVGTYDSPKSDGIYIYDFNSKTGSASFISNVKTANPSFLSVSKNKQFVYAVNETGKTGAVSSFSFNKVNGTLSLKNQVPSKGSDPCNITLSKNQHWAVVSNYSSGSFSILPILKDGTIGIVKQLITHTGKGFNALRQKAPHVHSAYFNKKNTQLHIADLGIDKIFTYPFNAINGFADTSKISTIITTPGSGPRHIDFSKNEQFMYALQELNNTIIVYKNNNGNFIDTLQTISTLPQNFVGDATGADIHLSPSGHFLYTSNRGIANSITIFRINKKNGTLTLIGHQPTLGKTPRNFSFDPTGKFLLVANQNSDEMVVFKINKKTGLLIDTGNKIQVGKPVCIKWVGKIN